IASLCLFMVKVIVSPLSFTDFDAFLHWKTAEDITSSGHLFNTNPLLPASPFYPGLEIVTNALSTLSGLSIFHAEIIMVAIARLSMVLSLFITCELLTKSARTAGIAMMIYISNSQFVFFDAMFSYETLALPLATVLLFAVTHHQIISAHLTHL